MTAVALLRFVSSDGSAEVMITNNAIFANTRFNLETLIMNSIIYLVGLIVIVMAILSFLGLR